MKKFGLYGRAATALLAAVVIGSAPLATGGTAWAAADVSPPTLVSGSVDKKTFNLADGSATFTVTIRTTDPSGVETPIVSASSTTTTQSAGFGQMTLVSGTTANGTWQRTISIPATAAPGTWEITLFPLSDKLGNSSNFTTVDTITLNAPTPPDVSPPALVSGSVDKKTFNLADGSATFTVTIRTTDPSGVETPIVSASSTTTTQSAGFGQMTLVSGTTANGTWQRTISIPATAAPGTWEITLFPLSDKLGNSSNFTTVDTITLTTKSTLIAGTPTVSGTAAVGLALTAKTGTWTPTTLFTYKWLANGVVLSGATSQTYTPTAGTVGKKLAVQVTGSLAGYDSESKTSGATAAVANGTLSSATPVITGTAKVSSRLTANAGKWTSGASLTYQWAADGASITGATKAIFTPTAAQLGKKITVSVTGTLAGYSAKSVRSAATTGAIRGTLTTSTPTISGMPKVGVTLTAKPGLWTPGTAYSYQWLANDKAIVGATKNTFKPTSAQRGLKVSVQVTGILYGYSSTGKKSAQTAAVAK